MSQGGRGGHRGHGQMALPPPQQGHTDETVPVAGSQVPRFPLRTLVPESKSLSHPGRDLLEIVLLSLCPLLGSEFLMAVSSLSSQFEGRTHS